MSTCVRLCLGEVDMSDLATLSPSEIDMSHCDYVR